MVTREEVLKLAALAKLYVSEDELDRLTAEMDHIISFADAVNSVGAAEEGFDNINNLENAFREDEVQPSFDRQEILQNADCAEDGFFVVKKRQ